MSFWGATEFQVRLRQIRRSPPENLVLLLVEAHYGFVKSDALGAFVAYTDAV